jgi:hypothetical protein
MRLYPEKTHHKKGMVEWLKCEALSSNPSAAKKKKKESYQCMSFKAIFLNNTLLVGPSTRSILHVY